MIGGRRPTIVAVGLVTACFAALVLTLLLPGELSRDVAFFSTTWEVPSTNLPVDLHLTESWDGQHIHTLTLAGKNLPALAGASQMRLLMATYGDPIRLREAELHLGHDCTFRPAPDATLKDNTFFVLTPERGAACAALMRPDAPKEGPIDLVIHSTGARRVAVWSAVPKSAPYEATLAILTPAGAGTSAGTGITPVDKVITAFPYGNFHPDVLPPAMSRAALLGAMWGFPSDSKAVICGGLLAALLLTASGAAALTRPRLRRLRSLALGLVFAGLSVAYAILIPPFQAPDEPGHLLTLAALVQRPELADGALTLANRGHLERLKFRIDEKFTTLDATATLPAPWAAMIAPTETNRSYIAQEVWPIILRIFTPGSANAVVLIMRLVNSLFVAACVAAGGLMAHHLLKDQAPPFWTSALPFFVVPTLPFFSMLLSNYSYLVGGYVLQVWALWAILAPGALIPGVGAILGLGLAVAAYAGHAGPATSLFWLTAGAIRLTFEAGTAPQRLVRAVSFYAAAAAAYLAVALPLMKVQHIEALAEPTVKFLGKGLAVLGLVAVGGKLAAACLLALVPLGFALLPRPTGLIDRIGRWCDRPASRRLGASLVALALLYTVFATHASTPDIEPPNHPFPSWRRYAVKVVESFILGLGAGPGDFYIVQSFWGGFGWLETILPSAMLRALRALPTLGLAALALQVWRGARDGTRLAALAMPFALLVYLVLLAYGCFSLQINLHGRYLIGLYLFTLVISCLGLRSHFGAKAALPSAVGCGLIHTISLIFLLGRYF